MTSTLSLPLPARSAISLKAATGSPCPPLVVRIPESPTLKLAMDTIDAAYQNHLEKETGSIEAGKLADLIVLDRNLFAVPSREIHRVRVLRTLLEGKTVYRAEH